MELAPPAAGLDAEELAPATLGTEGEECTGTDIETSYNDESC